MPLSERRLVVVFDLDDTLYLEASFVKSGFQAVASWVFSQHGIEGFFAKAWQLFADGHRGNVFDLALVELGIGRDPEFIQELVSIYRSHRPRIFLAPDATRMLERRSRWEGAALLTDGWALTQQRKIDALGLEALCHPIVRTDVWGGEFWKPHPRGFRTLQSHFGGPPCRFTYVADNPAKDFAAPRSLGWKTINIRRPGALHTNKATTPMARAERVIVSLDQMFENEIKHYMSREQ
jgi:putative hydrolase of the HAD superfamily